MAKETTYAGILGDWRRLLAPLNVNREDLAHLEGSRTKLEALLTQVTEINQQQALHRAEKQERTKRLRALVPEGQRLATLLRQAVKEHYGIRNEKLAEFGIQPFRGRLRAVKPAPQPEPDEPETSPSPPTTTLEAAEDT